MTNQEKYIIETTGGPRKVFRKRRRRNPYYQEPARPAEPKITEDWYRAVLSQLRLARGQKRLSQMLLANTLKTKQPAISQFERGLTNPTLNFLIRYAEAVDRKIELLLK